MRTNPLGLDLIAKYTDEYDAVESRTASERAILLYCRYPLNSNQFSALVPLVMHIGIDAFIKSAVLRYINRGWIFKAADAFEYYIYLEDEDGRFIDEYLICQRGAEKKLFLMPEVCVPRRSRVVPKGSGSGNSKPSKPPHEKGNPHNGKGKPPHGKGKPRK